MIIKQLNPHSCKTYLIKEKNKNDIILVDPVLEQVQDYLKLITDNKYNLIFTIDTHTHADHISGAAVLKDHTECEYIMGINSRVKCAGYRIKEGDKINFGGIKIDIVDTPGHTKDSITLIINEIILTGDALFLDDGGAGRDDLPGGDSGEHWESLQKFKTLPEDLIVHPAHDYRNRQPSSLSNQIRNNPHFRPKTKQEYIKYLEDLKLGPADWMKDVLKANYACAMDLNAAWVPADMNACEVKGTMDKSVNQQEVEPITAEELKKSINDGVPLFLLDVREPKELSSPLGHIENIVNISVLKLTEKLKELEKYKDKQIISVCRSGGRAYTAAQILKQAGFDKVKVLKDGMIGWNEQFHS